MALNIVEEFNVWPKNVIFYGQMWERFEVLTTILGLIFETKVRYTGIGDWDGEVGEHFTYTVV
jgi:hypothetical protein